MAQHLDTISPEQAGSLAGVIIERIKRSPDALAYRQFDKQTQAWLDMSWAEMGGHIARWQSALKNDGFGSVGCTHCTQQGEGRNGRWKSSNQSECGLHPGFFGIKMGFISGISK